MRRARPAEEVGGRLAGIAGARGGAGVRAGETAAGVGPGSRPVAVFLAVSLGVALLAGACGRQTGQLFRAADGSEVRGNPRRGAELFGQMGCNGCHTINGVGGRVGPDLTNVARLDLARDRPGRRWPGVVAYLRESIEDPQAYIVPTFENPSRMPSATQFKLSERDVNDLLAYLLSLQR